MESSDRAFWIATGIGIIAGAIGGFIFGEKLMQHMGGMLFAIIGIMAGLIVGGLIGILLKLYLQAKARQREEI